MKISFKIVYLLSIWLVLTAQLGFAQGVFNAAGTSLVTNGNINIVINNGGFKNDGNFKKGNSTLFFTGNASTANSFVSGSSLSDFNNFTVNKTANGVQLNADISVGNILKMQSGDSLFLNQHNIDLGTTGTISGEVNNRRVTGLTGGYIKAIATLNMPAAANPGNMGLAITSTVNMGSTEIKRFCKKPLNKCINRYFEITPTNNSGLNATLTCYYFDAELNGISEWDLNMHSSLDSGIFWVLDGKTAINTTLNYVTMNLYNKLQMITLADIYMTLPVADLNLNAHLLNKQTVVEWTGVYSMGNPVFEIEHSVNGKDFNRIGIVKEPHNYITGAYAYTDQLPVPGFNYYRLKQFTAGNRQLYSGTVLVKYNPSPSSVFITYPNPARGLAKTVLIVTEEKDARVILFNTEGKPALIKNVHLIKGMNEIIWDITALSSGSYYIGLTGENLQAEKLIKL